MSKERAMSSTETQRMRIKILASTKEQFPTPGPYKTMDIVERESPYQVGDTTHYGEVILMVPPALLDDTVEQGVVVKLDPMSLETWCEESVMAKPPSSYDRIEFVPISGARAGWGEDPPLTGPYAILPSENLTIENVSHLITPKTFSLWKNDCFVSKHTAESLESVRFAIVHRHSSPNAGDVGPHTHSAELIDSAGSCLALIRPTRRSRAMHIRGIVKSDGFLDPQGFGAREELADVPEIQKLFSVREQDITLLISILPEFTQIYQKENGNLTDDYEPLRMAVQLYGEAYLLSYWKARHILWWSAIEALFGNSEDAAMARIYALFGNKDDVEGYRCPIYEKGDIPTCVFPTKEGLHTLGEVVPHIYAVRNQSAHGQKVSDFYFTQAPHPFGQTVVWIDVLAEAVTLIIRKTVIEILRRGWRDEFKDRDTREHFWMMKYALPKNQGTRRLRELKESLKALEQGGECLV
jgi:hypothetical protein